MKNFKELQPPVKAGPEHYEAADCDSEVGFYACTLASGHSGQHEAAGVREIFATWDD